jgi:hypothetical protein
MGVRVTVTIEDQRLQDLLTNALEGGSNYWYILREMTYPKGQTRESLGIEFEHVELPFKGGSITIGDYEAAHKPDAVLDRKAIKKGLKIMAAKELKHFADFLAENDDATTGDVFLQCCCFGEVIYG